MPPRPAEVSVDLKGPPGAPVVYLLDVASELEERMLLRWVRNEAGPDAETILIDSSRRRRRGGQPEALAARAESGDNPFFLPLRVVWMAPKHRNRREVGWSDLFKPGDPRDPFRLRAQWVRLISPGRVKLLAAEGARASSLAAARDQADEVISIEAFITRRAWRALDIAERHLRGNRYKIPRFVPEAILSRRDFIEAVDKHAADSGEDPLQIWRKAERYLREMAATHSPYLIDIIANAIHALYRQGYGQIRYRPEQVAALARLGTTNSLVFLPSHRSNLDRLSLQFLLWENDLPPNHTAGGINLNFFPIGPLLRRTGVFFIRRSFKDNDLYKAVLRSYIDYLIEKRFPLEWYIEGGRSRSGKLLPPRFGLLQYVVGAVRRGKADEVMLMPVSISYDQIQDVPAYAREAQGRPKERESLRWMIRSVRSLRRRYGDIHIRFGEPISVASTIGEIDDEEQAPVSLQKLAFEVMHRIAAVTPVTPISLVSIALLEAGGKARTAGELALTCRRLAAFVETRNIEMTDTMDLADPAKVTVVLDWLAEHGSVSSHEAVGRRVFWLDEDQMIRVSYYRNMVVHFFVNRAIGEMALASLTDQTSPTSQDVRDRALELRDLLKFEFFFAERDQFLDEISADLAVDAPDWETTLPEAGASSLLTELGEPVAHWSLLPFLDAYQIVGDELESLRGPFEEKPFLQACLARGRMYRIEERLISGESVSQVLFKSALALAQNRRLLDEGDGVEKRRKAFAAEVRHARRLAASRT